MGNDKDKRHIVILATSDVHGNFTGYDYAKNKAIVGGLARVYTYVKKVRQENENVILLDAGDSIQGSVMLDEICSKNPSSPHPVMELMNEMSYDAMTLGNHDFDFGVPVQKAILAQGQFPILAANIKNPDGTLLTGQGYTIVERAGVRVAVIGVVMPYIKLGYGFREGVEKLECISPDLAVKGCITELRDKADIFVLCAHMDKAGEYDPEGGSDSAGHVAIVNPELDIVQCAHTHRSVSGKVILGENKEVIFGEVINGARDILRFDIDLDEAGQITDKKAQIICVSDLEPAKEIVENEILCKLHECTLEYLSHRTEEKDDSPVIAKALTDFQRDGRFNGKIITPMMETPIMQLVGNIFRQAANADVAACNFISPDIDIKAGPITEKMIEKIYSFPNFLIKVKITGYELMNYLEYSVCGYKTYTGDGEVEICDNMPEFMPDFFVGIEYEINMRKPVWHRIENVRFKGATLSMNQELTLAVNNYRLNIDLKTWGLGYGVKQWQSKECIKDILVRYMSEMKTLSPVTDGNWKVVK